MPKTNPVPFESEVGYNDGAYIWIIRERYGILRARLLNLAETSAVNETQSKAMKGLIKDFCNEAYYDTLHNLEPFLRFFKVLPDGPMSAGGPLPPIEEREVTVN